ncbi:hypothetical protein BC937DRAFT_87766 [Endogone sp. FLAS-F59071]|nr:hypothetical protein BC937DRAFT_87766 [Endogone sp. FLAS-F59071]|eukprot:RUS19248.1 hypothetical protein BC937DRAFT_87766 [Endogone sp. FLAS-F59071]
MGCDKGEKDIVLPKKFPFSYPLTTIPRPSNSMLAPCLIPLSISASALCFACGLISGPRSASGSIPAVTFNPLALSTSSGSHFCDSPTNTAVESAIHLCPAAPNAAPASWLSVCCLFASGIMTP